MKRFTLGNEHAAGFYILDGRNMSVAYLDAKARDEAQAYVDAANQIEDIRVKQAVDLAAAKARLYAFLKGGKFAA